MWHQGWRGESPCNLPFFENIWRRVGDSEAMWFTNFQHVQNDDVRSGSKSVSRSVQGTNPTSTNPGMQMGHIPMKVIYFLNVFWLLKLLIYLDSLFPQVCFTRLAISWMQQWTTHMKCRKSCTLFWCS